MWNITSRSSSFPCRSPQIVICFDMAVEAWLKFGNLLSCMADSFNIPATYFACRRCCCKEKTELFDDSSLFTSLPCPASVVQSSRYSTKTVQCRPIFTLLYQDCAMSSSLHVTVLVLCNVVHSSCYFTKTVQCRPIFTLLHQ